MQIGGAKALVTGGSAGIGRALAALLRAKGADVAIMARRREPLERTARELGVHPIQGDVGDEAAAERAVAECVARFGRLDVLVNNAGIGHFASLVDMDPARFAEVFRVNVTGAMLMARAAARRFVAQRSGNVVNVSSTSGLRGDAGGTAYAASKFALRGMSECWRQELRRSDVRVILVNPSEVVTDFARSAGFEQEDSPKKLRPEDIAHAIVAALEMEDRGFVPELTVFATNPF